MIFNQNKKRGYSLIEMLVYIAILTVFSVTIINTIISFTRSYRNVLALRMLDNTSIDAMERMTRDIRASASINTGLSTLGSSPGVLTLVSTAGGVSTTTKFYVDNGVLKVDVNGAYLGPVSVSNTTITSLVFTKISNTNSDAVKVDMTVQAVVGTVTKTKTYHATIILKGI